MARSRYGRGKKVTPAFPCSVPVTLVREVAGKPDEYGNPTSRWERKEILVFGVALGGTDDVATATHPEATRYDATVYAPVAAGIRDRDRIEIDRVVYEVDGAPGNWDMNPYWSPGLVQVKCVRVAD